MNTKFSNQICLLIETSSNISALSHVGLGELFRVSTTTAQELGTKIKASATINTNQGFSRACHEPFSNNMVKRKSYGVKKRRWR